MKLWGEIPDLQVARFEFSECGRSVEWRVGCGFRGVSKGRSRKGLLLCRALSSACGRLGRQGIGMGKGVRVGQRTLALVPTPILIPDGFFLVSPCVTLSLFLLGSPKVDTLR